MPESVAAIANRNCYYYNLYHREFCSGPMVAFQPA